MLYVLSNCLCECESSSVLLLIKEYDVLESWTTFMIIPQLYIQNQLSFVDPLFILGNSDLFMRTMYSRVCIYNSSNGRNRASFAEALYILENGDVSGRLDTLITTTLGFNLDVYCESLVSLQW